MEQNGVASVQLGHETNWKPRNTRSPSNNCSPAFREGYVVDGSGCGRWLQRFIGPPMEAGVETWKQAPVQAPSRQTPQAVRPPADRIDRCFGSRHSVLGICAGWMDRTFSARRDPATVRRRVSSGIRAAFAASIRLESAEAGAASPRTERGGHCPLASRILAATKKRASNVKLAWFFSMKVGFCCNPCGGVCGRRGATRPCNVRGIDAIESQRSPPSPERRGRCGLGCTTNSWITMRGRRISFGSCAKSTDICVAPSFWCGIACRRIALPPDNCLRKQPLGFKWNGFRLMPRTLTLLRMSGISPSTEPWRTSFRTTFTICTPHWIKSSKPFGTNPTACTRFLTRHI